MRRKFNQFPSSRRTPHSIALESADSADAIYVYGVEFTPGKSGLSIHNLAHGYSRSEALGGDPECQMTFLQQIPGKIDGAIIALGLNDSINGAGTTAEQYSRVMHWARRGRKSFLSP